jgi:hypothetical protein
MVHLKNIESPDCYNVLKPTTITQKQAPVSVIISLLSTLYICVDSKDTFIDTDTF